jgi:hypothetical protein
VNRAGDELEARVALLGVTAPVPGVNRASVARIEG